MRFQLPSERKALAFLKRHLPRRQHKHIIPLGPMRLTLPIELFLPEDRMKMGARYGRVIDVPAGALGLGFEVPEQYQKYRDPESWIVMQLDPSTLHLWEAWHGDWVQLTPMEIMALLGSGDLK